jgi:hypothetical protein
MDAWLFIFGDFWKHVATRYPRRSQIRRGRYPNSQLTINEKQQMANGDSIEKAASKVEVATAKVEQTTSKNASTTMGRTAWDALVDMGAMLGPYTPRIIIVAGALYGVYQFIGLKSTMDAKVDDAKREAQKDVASAQAAVKDTYKQISAMHSEQLQNLKSMLEVNQGQRMEFENMQKEANKAKQSTEQAKEDTKRAQEAAAQARTNADEAKREIDEAQRIRIQLDTELQRIEEKLEKSRETQFELNRKETVLRQRAAQITELRRKLIDTAKSLVSFTDPNVAALGRKIQEDALPEAEKLLAEYATNPGDDIAAQSLEDLIGFSEAKLEIVLSKELGFAVWQKYSKKDETETAYIGVVHQTHLFLEGVVLLTVRETRVEDVDVFPKAFSVIGWDPNNWDKAIGYNLYPRPTGELGIDRFRPRTGQWTIQQAMTDFANEGPPKQIHGEDKPLWFMKFEDFKNEKGVYEEARRANRLGFADVVAMLENEKSFEADGIAESFSAELPKGLRKAFVQLLTEAVKHAEVKTVKIASASRLPPEVYGRIAAAALKPDFKIVGVGARQGSTMTSTKGETFFIRCQYHNVRSSASGAVPSEATITFTREGPDEEWMLLNFESSAPVEE